MIKIDIKETPYIVFGSISIKDNIEIVASKEAKSVSLINFYS
jgi:hypothetical protein